MFRAKDLRQDVSSAHRVGNKLKNQLSVNFNVCVLKHIQGYSISSSLHPGSHEIASRVRTSVLNATFHQCGKLSVREEKIYFKSGFLSTFWGILEKIQSDVT